MFSLLEMTRSDPIESRGSMTQWALKRSHNSCASDMWVISPSRGCVFGCLFCPIRNRLDKERQVCLYTDLIQSLDSELISRSRLKNQPSKVMFDLASDPFQPIEDLSRLVVEILSRLLKANWDVYLVTRGVVSPEYKELFTQYASKLHIQVGFFTMDSHLTALFEKNAPSVEDRLESVRRMVKWGVDVRARLGPFVPFVSDTVSHIEDLLRYLRSTGIRKCYASYLTLKPHMLESFRLALPRAQYQLIKGSFQRQPWQKEGIQNMTKSLPARIRLPGYERMFNLAKRTGMNIDFCACMNPRQVISKGSQSCFESIYEHAIRPKQRGQLELFIA